MQKSQAVQAIEQLFDSQAFLKLLDARIAYKTESQEYMERQDVMQAYLKENIIPYLATMGFTAKVYDSPIPNKPPFMIAERIEPNAAFTVLTYGHGDVVRGYDQQWFEGLQPWKIVVREDKWYGRGTADNKGQHTINLAALKAVLDERKGLLGYNVKVLLEMGEESGSPGLERFCAEHAKELAADVFIASDGPRLAAERPTLFLGSRGVFNFDLKIKARAGGHHSGNWGGLLSNPGTRLAHAIACMMDAKGRILVKGLLPPPIPAAVRAALKSIHVGGGAEDPEICADWGEPDQTPSERVFAWNALEVLAFKTGNPEHPVNAIPPMASAHCQLRYVVGTDSKNAISSIQEHLNAHGFEDVEVSLNGEIMEASRLDPQDPWVEWALDSVRTSTGKEPALLPNLGGSLPNDVFSGTLGLPTIWVPHSYAACSQHAPNEHILGTVTREALQLMTALWWDLAEQGPAIHQKRQK